MIPWFDRAFGPWYERLYPHRSQEEADRAISGILPWLPEGRVLDIGSGAGRHVRSLLAHGRDAIGIDRSAALLATAARDPELAGRIVRADMRRLPFGRATFSAVLSMFTSFGYFGSLDAHRELLREYRAMVRDDGRLVLDYLNATAVRSGLVPESSRMIENHEVREERRVVTSQGEDRVVKQITIREPGGAVAESYHEEVSLYSPEEVDALLTASGWRPLERRGGYQGEPWSGESARLLILAEAVS